MLALVVVLGDSVFAEGLNLLRRRHLLLFHPSNINQIRLKISINREILVFRLFNHTDVNIIKNLFKVGSHPSRGGEYSSVGLLWLRDGGQVLGLLLGLFGVLNVVEDSHCVVEIGV